MRENAEILDLFTSALECGRKMVLATVVDVSGSAYRRPGAHLLLVDDGRKAGSISAGCLENDLLARGNQLFESSECLLLEYENDEFFGLNYGCDGTIFVFVQPVSASSCCSPVALKRVQETARTFVLATVFDSDERALIGKQFLFDTETPGEPLFSSSELTLETNSASFREALADLRSEIIISSTEVARLNNNQKREFSFQSTKVFFEIIKPTLRLAVFGAGDDVIPLLHVANSIGIETHIIDSRRSYLDRFASQSFIHTHDQNFSAETVLGATESTAAVIMSHSFELDKRFLSAVLETDCAFIGVMGSRKRTLKLLKELDAESQVSRIRFPVGLDIGAETPEEIALSICSEVLAFFRNASGKPLTSLKGNIHRRTDRESIYQLSEKRTAQCTIGDTIG